MNKNLENEARINRRLCIDLSDYETHEPFSTTFKRFFSEYKGIFMQLRVFLQFTFIDAKARKASYCLSFFSVFLVVFLCVVMLSTLFNLPIVFLRLGEANRAQNDLQLAAGGEMQYAVSLNYSIIEEIFPPTDEARSYHAPRITWNANVINYATCKGIKNIYDLWFNENKSPCYSGCVFRFCDADIVRQRIISIDRAREERMGFDASWNAPKFKKGEVIISKGAAIAANETKIGDTILLYADINSVFVEATKDIRSVVSNPAVIIPMKVVGIVDSDNVKFNIDDFVIMDFESTLELIGQGLSPFIDNSDKQKISKLNPKSSATTIHFNLPPSIRLDTYKTSDYNSIRRRISSWASTIIDPIGFNQLSVDTPLVRFLNGVRFFSLFVGLIMSLILAALGFLSLVLIYSLLNVSVETRIYEFGIQRMIGFSRKSLVLMILTNAYSFAIPAWALGLIIGQLVYLGIRVIVNNLIGAWLSILIPATSIIWATLAGMLLPFIGSIPSIFTVSTQKLSDALNVSRSRNTGVIYKIVKERNLSSFNFLHFGLGLAFAAFGFLLYYLFPVSLTKMQLAWIFYIFFGTLIGMLAGFVILTVNLERVIQTVFLYIFFFWETGAVFQAVQKCLDAHRRRNRKTTLLYALALGFIVFITIAFQIELTSFQYGIRRTMGSEIVINAGSMNLFNLGELAYYIKVNIPEIESLAYTASTKIPSNPIQNITLSPPGRYRDVATKDLLAISPNFFEVLEKEFLLVDKYNEESKLYSLGGALYNEKRNKIIIPTSAYKSISSIYFEDPLILIPSVISNRATNDVNSLRFVVQPSSILSAAPQVSMSTFENVIGDVLTSFPTAARLTSIDYLSVSRLPLGQISLRVPNPNDVEIVNSLLQRYLRSKRIDGAAIRDDAKIIEYLGIADRMLGFFFIFTQIMTLLICFFSLLSSMTANVMESSKDIGIYRCIGMKKLQIYRIFIWESFIIVMAASFMGIIVGIIVGYTMQLQNYLFTQLSIPFVFPYIQVAIVVGMAVGAALLSSYGPVTYLMRLPSITHILRRTF